MAPQNRPRFLYIVLMPRANGRSIDARIAEITNLLKAWGSGDEAALARLAEHVYPELRLMARRYMKNEAQGNTLQASALVHEVYLRLVDVTNVEWQARAQFFAIAAQMMRRILVDAARTRGSRRRDGILSEAAGQGTKMADHFSPIFRPAFPSSAILSERSSPSRVRFAASNNGAPLTAPGRSGQHF